MKLTKEITTKAGIGFSIAVSIFSLSYILTVHGHDAITIKDFALISLLLPFILLWLDKKIAYDQLFEQYERFRESVVIQSRMAADTDGDGSNLHHLRFGNLEQYEQYVLRNGNTIDYPLAYMWTNTTASQPVLEQEKEEPETIKLDDLIKTLDERYLSREEASRLYQPKSVLSGILKNGRRPNKNMEDVS